MLKYYSTTSLSKAYSFQEILDIYDQFGVENVELGVCLDQKLNAKLLIKKYNFNYIIHHLFPPPKDNFIINLSSANSIILKKSIAQVKKTIDFCEDNDVKLFSFHSGFRSDPNSQFKFNFTKITDYETSFNIFSNSLQEILTYSEERNVKIAIENNVLADYNMTEGRNDILLMCELWEFQKLFRNSNLKKVGLLIDLGHLKVTAKSLNFDPEEFINSLKDRIIGLHVHDNNGVRDQHICINEGDWTLDILKKYFNHDDIPIINECTIQNKQHFEKFYEFFSNF